MMALTYLLEVLRRKLQRGNIRRDMELLIKLIVFPEGYLQYSRHISNVVNVYHSIYIVKESGMRVHRA